MIAAAAAGGIGMCASAATTPVTVRVFDWASMPFSGNISASSGNPSYMARINFTKEEPGNTGRMWTCDLNGNLYIFSKGGTPATRTAELLTQARNRSAYLDFNGRTADAAEMVNIPDAAGAATSQVTPNGLFPFFTKKSGYANGLVTFEFDPSYATNGKFYTIHIEAVSEDDDPGRVPLKTKFPGFNTTGYTPTPVVKPPTGTGTAITRQAVLIEWTDTNRSNLTFEGTARELLRVGFNSHIHPLGDITFNPAAEPGDPEWGVMYLACGDGGSGENNTNKLNPQRLDSLVGKILRIIPDLSLHTGTSTVSLNTRYRIPNDNPFAGAAFNGARKEIWTLGHRNPHRFVWKPSSLGTPQLLVTEIGLNAWEEVNLLKPGKNYGYSQREGPQRLTISSGSPTLGNPPSPDTLPVRLDGSQTFAGEFVPEYPLIAYPHTAAYGDAISNGFFYRGTAIPALQGKFVFADITTGRLWCSDWSDMIDADDGAPATLANMQPITLVWDNPNDSPDAGPQSYERFFEIVKAGYDFRGGVDSDLPGGATISGTGRADIRLAVDASGELFVTSKSDGVIRGLGIVTPPAFSTQPVDKWISVGTSVDFTVAASSNPAPGYRWQRQTPGSILWEDLSDDSVCSGTGTATLHLQAPTKERSGDLYRCVASCTGAQAASSSAMLEMKVVPLSWLSTYFDSKERARREVAGDYSDPDRDGIVNLLEYAFGFDPEKNSAAQMPKVVKSGSNATLSFPASRTDVTYGAEVSTDMITWTSSGVTITTNGNTKTASYPMSAKKAFLRVTVK